MKCEFCGGNLFLEAKYCPHCGQLNKHAQQHIRDMERYQGAFEETKKEIHSVSKSYSKVTVRAIMIVALLILLVIFTVVGAEAYSFVRDWEKGRSERNAEKYIQQIDDYLAKEDYLTLAVFIEERNINGYGYGSKKSAYNTYVPVIRACQAYDDVYYQIVGLTYREEESRERAIKGLGEALDIFYQFVDPDYYGEHYWEYDEGKCKQPLETMELYVQKLLQTYCNLSEEEAASLKELSDAKRIVLIEERLGYGE